MGDFGERRGRRLWRFAGVLLAGMPGCLPLPTSTGIALPGPADSPAVQLTAAQEPDRPTTLPPPATEGEPEAMPIDLPTALRLVNEANPTIALARERVQQAYARLQLARVIPLPDLLITPLAYGRHDGQFQTFNGPVITTSYGNVANNAALLMRFESADAYYLPLIARQQSRAAAEAARATTNNQQLDVALAYLDLLSVYGQLAVNAEALANASVMLRNAESAALAGKSKTGGDVQRARTEVEVRKQERVNLIGDVGVRSARLAELLLLPPTVDLRPVEPAVVPITLVPVDRCLEDMVDLALSNRPELGETRAQREAAREAYRQARAKPYLPRVDVSYYGGGFGGGANDVISNYSGRGDGLAQLVWQLDNLGAGNAARIRETQSVYRQSNYQVVATQARVAREVTEAAKVARARLQSLESAQEAVRQGVELWRRLSAASFGFADGKYDPIEPLIAEQQLAQARNLYLSAVIAYNQAQFRLYTALGQPPQEALDKAEVVPTQLPTFPPPGPSGKDG